MSSSFSYSDLVDEINALRTNPRRYANKVTAYKKYFKDNVLRLPGTNAGIRTQEGPAAYTEAGEFLQKQSRIEALTASKGLCKIAQELLKEIQKCDDASCLNDIDMDAIKKKYGRTKGEFSTATDYGSETPEQVIVNLVVDDGDKTRAQRQFFFSTEIKRVGVANGSHPTYGRCTVIVSCNTFENSRDKDDTEDFSNCDYTAAEANVNTKKAVSGSRVITNEQKKNEDIEDELPEGVVSLSKSEKIVIEGGKKKRLIKITKVLEDGSKEIETIKESVEEN